ncbi:hypothetical protein [Streptomyces sp. NRRL B-24484]|uniref:hypothetical protein n=1 Tax=Streptomyces sp. NRRL B-24484 TaxID=1463833 RepID=UPI0004C12D64|nr:hypothetical protein [Streptomyces sp. NRRL B-24484]
MSTTTFETAAAFVAEADSVDQLRTLRALCEERIARLSPRPESTATMVRIPSVGERVRLQKIRPQYLIGLTGIITDARRTRVDVALDAESTARLAATRQTRFAVPPGATTFLIEGAHVASIAPQD